MRIIFLDMDGVLNSGHYLHVENPITKHEKQLSQLWSEWASLSTKQKHSRLWGEMIDPKMVVRLNRIIESTGAAVVLSSSWRISFKDSMGEFREILSKRGFAGEVIDRTPVGSEMGGACTGVRGVEVAWWLARHKEVTDYVILDDADDFPGLEDRLVRTSWATGLLDEHVDRAIAILGRA